MTEIIDIPEGFKRCECCQCNEIIPIRDSRDRPRKYKKGHGSKGKIGMVGDKNPAWKGGRKDDGHGYVLIWKPDHPFCDRKGYILEHRLEMEKKLDRYLTEEEIIHHKDGNIKNNNINNLRLFENHSKHKKFENVKDMSGRICLICKSDVTWIRKSRGRPVWYVYRDGFACHKCYKKEFRKNKVVNP